MMKNQPQGRLPGDLEQQDLTIASHVPGVELFLRNKRLKVRTAGRGSVLLVHGATFSSVSLFDVDVGTGSFMDMLAQKGFDVWALDIRGYGGSSRLPVMSQAPSTSEPLVPAIEAVDDVSAAMAHIRKIRAVDRVALMGMSWGGSIAGIFASRHPETLSHLVLIAPLWLSAHPLRIDSSAPIMTHRLVDVNAYEAGWLSPVPEDRRESVLPAGWFERWSEMTEATDADAPAGKVRAPSGAVADVRRYWTAGKPLYDPASITAPVLMVRGEWDIDVTREMAGDLFDRLTQAQAKTWIEIAEATHMILMERPREVVTDAIATFLKD